MKRIKGKVALAIHKDTVLGQLLSSEPTLSSAPPAAFIVGTSSLLDAPGTSALHFVFVSDMSIGCPAVPPARTVLPFPSKSASPSASHPSFALGPSAPLLPLRGSVGGFFPDSSIHTRHCCSCLGARTWVPVVLTVLLHSPFAVRPAHLPQSPA